MNPNTANAITVCRIVLSLSLFLCPVFSVPFWIIYASAGATDILDGHIARRMGIASTLGSRLDTVADFIFFAVCLIVFIPVLDIPGWLYIWIAFIAAIKIVNIASGYMMQKRLVVAHTLMNKVSGLLLFILPMTFTSIELTYSSIALCSIATFAAVQEGHFIRTGRITD
ncbi:MAG: CDP-alcohol phosphatidyltransferase family protein [Candidatus Methanomethylophilaceae archaeon]|nr:CDP-alcohol phosphatidyltransferase family protein [Candidatus Methanomethylophilaceae archaeon]